MLNTIWRIVENLAKKIIYIQFMVNCNKFWFTTIDIIFWCDIFYQNNLILIHTMLCVLWGITYNNTLHITALTLKEYLCFYGSCLIYKVILYAIPHNTQTHNIHIVYKHLVILMNYDGRTFSLLHEKGPNHYSIKNNIKCCKRKLVGIDHEL